MKYRIYILLFTLLISYGVKGQDNPPVINEVSTDTGSIGNSVTITGENFATEFSNNIVRFGATIGDITALSSTELSVAIPSGADPFGPISITKLTNSSSDFSDPFQITFRDGVIYSGSYSNSTVTSGSDLQAGAAGDFDEDGAVDVAVASSSDNMVYLHFGDGTGSFGSQIQLDTDSGPEDVIATDYNNDGQLDIVTANSAAGTISLIPGNGDGTFGIKTDVLVGEGTSVGTTGEPLSVNRGDFNNDGFADLTVANYETDSVKVLINDGTGSFNDIRGFYALDNPYEVKVADFDDDGNDDIAVATGDISGTLILFGDGSGNFPETINMTSSSRDVTYGDYNGDGRLDLASCIGSTDRVYIFLNEGTRTFTYHTSIPTSTDPRELATGDFDGDGFLDIASANVDGNNVSVLVGNGTGDFPERTDFPVGTFPNDVVASNFNNDGKADFAVPNQNSSNISVLLYEDPYVKIDSVTDIQQDSMTVHAEALDQGETYYDKGVAWDTVPSPVTSDSSKSGGSGTGVYSVSIGELTPNTVYYVRPYVFTLTGTYYGNEVKVTTLPDVGTQQPSNIGPTYVESGGVINDTINGNGTINDRGLVWDTLANPDVNNDIIHSGAGTGSFSSLIKGLEPDTYYHIRAFAENETGVSYGNEYEFTTDSFALSKITEFIQWKKLISTDFSGSAGLAEHIDMHDELAIVSENGAQTAYIMAKDTGGIDNWGRITQLFKDSVNTSGFPTDVAIENDVAVLGSSFNQEQAFRNGAIYIAQKNSSNGQWDNTKKILPPDPDSYLSFGQQVDVYNNTLVVGADSAVYIYKRDQGGTNNWGFLKKITSPNAEDSSFGDALALYEDNLVVGSPLYLDNRGAAYLFNKFKGGTDNWGLVKNLTPDKVGFGDYFGQSVDIHGDEIIVGATSGDGSGAVYIFEQDQGGINNWGNKADLKGDGIEDAYGSQVVIEDGIALAGAYGNYVSDNNQGAVFVLAKDNSGTWVNSQKLTPDSGNSFYQFGRTISMSGKTAFFSSKSEVEGEDELYIFKDKGQEPSSFTLADDSVRENKAAGGNVGLFEADADDPDINYSLVDGTGSEGNQYFLIDGNQLITDTTFNYESKSTYSIRVNANNGERFNLDSIFSIQIVNENEAPEVNNPIENQKGVVGDSLIVNIPGDLFSDPDNDSLTHIVEIPEGSFLNYKENENRIVGLPAESDTGKTSITIIGKDDDGASDSTFFDVNIRPDIRVTLVPDEPTICRGEKLVLKAEMSDKYGTPSFAWYLNGDSISGAKDDSLTLEDISNRDLIKVEVEVLDSENELITLLTDSVPVAVYENPEATLDKNGFFISASKGVRYEWFLNNEKISDTTRSIIAKKHGEYKVKVYNDNGCSSVSESKYMYITDIRNGKESSGVVYPNPVNDQLTIEIKKLPFKGKGRLSVFKENGKVIYRQQMDQSTIKIDTQDWASGIYYLQISGGKAIISRKILKY